MSRYRLTAVAGEHRGVSFPLEGPEATVGRDPGNRIRLADAGISRHHARLVFEDAAWIVEDLGSTNGVKVGEQVVKRQALLPGDRIHFGSAVLLFEEAPATERMQAAAGFPAAPASPAPLADAPAAPAAGSETAVLSPPSRPAVRRAPAAAPSAPGPEGIHRIGEARSRILAELHKVIVGQDAILDEMLVALFARGHCLMVGVPGLAKTLIVKTLAAALDLQMKRIQFTPDLMPTDITGTDILEEDASTGKRNFTYIKGPIFTNLLLADEINRTPPKTQAALLEAMQERRVTAGGVTYELPNPFFVLATQNPIEQEGTYPLPEAQLDRFMFMLRIEYPGRDEEMDILASTTGRADVSLSQVMTAAQILEAQSLVRDVPVSRHVLAYVADLSRATRPSEKASPAFVKDWVTWGAGPRAGQYLVLAAKATAALEGRVNLSCADVRRAAYPVLRHRIFLNFQARTDGVDPDALIKRLLDAVKEPGEKDYA